jgi:hypothetical protein
MDMETKIEPEALFPAFTQFVRESGLLDRAKGNLAAKLPRILGQGTTRAVGLDCPPAAIERKLELATLKLPDNLAPPQSVVQEMRQAEFDVEQLKSELQREEGIRRLATRSLQEIDQPGGYKDGRFFAGRLILVPEKGGLDWAWSVTPHYSIIKRIPPDADYIAKAFEAAQRQIRDLTVPSGEFEAKLRLAWTLARHFCRTDDVLVIDVMKMFNVAGQDDKFWQSPQRQFFKDLPEAAFVINLIQWRLSAGSSSTGFEFVPATLHQAHGSSAKVFYLPMNQEGTEVRPMVYLRRRPQ